MRKTPAITTESPTQIHSPTRLSKKYDKQHNSGERANKAHMDHMKEKTGKIVKDAYDLVMAKHGAGKLYAKDLHLEFCKTLILECIEQQIPSQYNDCIIDDAFEATLQEVLSYFRSKIISEEFQTESEDKEEIIGLDEERQLKYKGFLQLNNLEFVTNADLFAKTNEERLDKVITEHCVKIFKYLEGQSEQALSAFRKKMAASAADGSFSIENDTVDEANWIKNSGLLENDKTLSGSLSDSTTKLIHLWIFHLEKKIEQLRECDTFPVVLTSRSKFHMNFKPSIHEGRLVRDLLWEAQKLFYESKDKVSFSAIFKKVKNLSPDHFSERVDYLVGYCTAMCRNFIKNQVVDLLKTRIKVLLYVEQRFNSEVDIDRRISLVDFECFGAVQFSCDMQQKFKSDMGNIEKYLGNDAKIYQLEKGLDGLGRKTTTLNLQFKWTESVEVKAQDKTKVVTYRHTYPVKLVIHQIANKKGGQPKLGTDKEMSNPKMTIRRAIEGMLKHKISIVFSWIDTVCLRRSEFVNWYDDILKKMPSSINEEKIGKISLRGDSVEIQDYDRCETNLWYLCAYCPMIVEKMHKYITTYQNKSKNQRICQWCLLQCLDRIQKRKFLLGEEMSGLVVDIFDMISNERDKALQNISEVWNKITKRLMEGDADQVLYIVGVESNGEKKLYRCFIDQETEELTLTRNYMEYAEVFIKPAKRFKVVYVIDTTNLQQRSYWQFAEQSIQRQYERINSKGEKWIPNNPRELTEEEQKKVDAKGTKIKFQDILKLKLKPESMELMEWNDQTGKFSDWNTSGFKALREGQWKSLDHPLHARLALQLLYVELPGSKLLEESDETEETAETKETKQIKTNNRRALVIDYFRANLPKTKLAPFNGVLPKFFTMSAKLICAQIELIRLVRENQRNNKRAESYEKIEKYHEGIVEKDFVIRSVRWISLFPYVTNIELDNLCVEKRIILTGSFPELKKIILKQEQSKGKSNIIELKEVNLSGAQLPRLNTFNVSDFESLDKILLPKSPCNDKSSFVLTVTNCGITDLSFIENWKEEGSLQLFISYNKKLRKISKNLISRTAYCTLKNNPLLDLSTIAQGNATRDPVNFLQLQIGFDKDQQAGSTRHKLLFPKNLNLHTVSIQRCGLEWLLWQGIDWKKLSLIHINHTCLATLDLEEKEMPSLEKLYVQSNLLENLRLPLKFSTSNFDLQIFSNNITTHNFEKVFFEAPEGQTSRFDTAGIQDGWIVYEQDESKGKEWVGIKNPCSKDTKIFEDIVMWSRLLQRKKEKKSEASSHK